MPSLLARAGRLATAIAALALLLPAAASAGPYADSVAAQRPLHWWRLGDAAAAPRAVDIGTAFPASGAWPGAYAGEGVRFGEPGALAGDGNTAVRLLGASTPNGVRPPLSHYFDTNYLGHGHMSWEAWIKPGVTDSTARRVMSSEDARGGVLLAARRNEVVFARYLNPGTYRMWSRTPLPDGPSGGAWATFSKTTWNTLSAPLEPGRWNHVVANYLLTVFPYPPHGTMDLYVNGKLTASRRTEMVPVLPNEYTPLVIGSNRGGWLRYDGWVDDVAVYFWYMSAGLVPEHYRMGRTGLAR